MVPQTQITEVVPEKLYAVAHQCGPTYDGPSGGRYFSQGLIHDGETPSGAQIVSSGLANITHYWEVKPDHELAWNGEAWIYRLKVKPMKKAEPVELPAPVPIPPKRRKKKGKQ